MPPFGTLYGQPVFVDQTLCADSEIVFNAGTHTDAIRMRYSTSIAWCTPLSERSGRVAH